jgi:hypothetical protein
MYGRTFSGLEHITTTEPNNSVLPKFIRILVTFIFYFPLTGLAMGLEKPKEKGQTTFGTWTKHDHQM